MTYAPRHHKHPDNEVFKVLLAGLLCLMLMIALHHRMRGMEKEYERRTKCVPGSPADSISIYDSKPRR